MTGGMARWSKGGQDRKWMSSVYPSGKAMNGLMDQSKSSNPWYGSSSLFTRGDIYLCVLGNPKGPKEWLG